MIDARRFTALDQAVQLAIAADTMPDAANIVADAETLHAFLIGVKP